MTDSVSRGRPSRRSSCWTNIAMRPIARAAEVHRRYGDRVAARTEPTSRIAVRASTALDPFGDGSPVARGQPQAMVSEPSRSAIARIDSAAEAETPTSTAPASVAKTVR